MPSGTPISIASTTATSMIDSVIIVRSQNPQSPTANIDSDGVDRRAQTGTQVADHEDERDDAGPVQERAAATVLDRRTTRSRCRST